MINSIWLQNLLDQAALINAGYHIHDGYLNKFLAIVGTQTGIPLDETQKMILLNIPSSFFMVYP